jgi:protein kinase C substrate 80K-H
MLRTVFDLESYIPDSIFPAYDKARTSMVGWLTAFGVVRGTSQPSEGTCFPLNRLVPPFLIGFPETAKARDAHSKAINALHATERKVEDETRALEKLFDPEWFGSEGEWKKLESTCLTKDTGEYIYEVCLFGAATQRSSNGGGSHSLGCVRCRRC